MTSPAWPVARSSATGRPGRLRPVRLPFPPAFVVKGPGRDRPAFERGVAALEAGAGRRLGDPAEPLLVSVAADPPVSSGAGSAFSHLGLSDATLAGYAALIGDEAAAWGRYERLVRAFAVGVRGLPADALAPPGPGTAEAVRNRVAEHLEAVAAVSGRPFPQEPAAQLGEVVAALVEAGSGAGATAAVTVSAMVHGDAVGRSGAGTAFTRNPATGERAMAGEFYPAVERAHPTGSRDPIALDDLVRWHAPVRAELQRVSAVVEESLGDLAEIDFVVERGVLWVLDVRVAAPSAVARLATLLDLWQRGAMALPDVLDRMPPAALIRVAEPGLAAGDAVRLGRGVGVSPGVVAGPLTLSPRRARQLGGWGARPVLVTEDGAGAGDVLAAGAVVSAGGGHSSHLAAVARELEHPAVCRVGGLSIGSRQARFGSVAVDEGTEISVDGSTGDVYLGAGRPARRRLPDDVVEFLAACDARRRVRLLAEGRRAAWADGVFDPSEATICTRPAQLDVALAADRPVAISPGDDAPLQLIEIARELTGYGIEVMLRVDGSWPRSLVRLPAGPWSAVIATPEAAAAGRMLAALLTPEPVSGAGLR